MHTIEQKYAQYATMNDSGFLALPLDAQNLTQQSNLWLLEKQNLLRVDDMTTKQAGIGSAWGTGPAVLNR